MNPFETIEERLSGIENLLLDFKNQPQKVATTEQPEQFLSVQETAQFLNLTVPTIYSKVSKRELPVMKKGKRLYFFKEELLGYLKSGRVKTATQLENDADDYLSNYKKD